MGSSDKTKAPTYYLKRIPDEPDTQLIVFTAGPPYEDIAFRIVRRPWEHSHRRGFRSTYDRGVLQRESVRRSACGRQRCKADPRQKSTSTSDATFTGNSCVVLQNNTSIHATALARPADIHAVLPLSSFCSSKKCHAYTLRLKRCKAGGPLQAMKRVLFGSAASAMTEPWRHRHHGFELCCTVLVSVGPPSVSLNHSRSPRLVLAKPRQWQ